MLHEWVLGSEIFARLAQWDGDLARVVAAEGCQHCGGPLHQSNYARKPRGGGLAAVAGDAFALRHSLCCGRRGCRRRVLPPSLRFLGRRVYLGAVVFLASVCAQAALSMKAAQEATRIPRVTLGRWQTWWREQFPVLPTWAELRARFVPPPPDEAMLPGSLLSRVEHDLTTEREQPPLEAVVHFVLRSLAPMTTSSVADGSRFVRAVAARLSPRGDTQKM
jgi:hypothetical protein